MDANRICQQIAGFVYDNAFLPCTTIIGRLGELPERHEGWPFSSLEHISISGWQALNIFKKGFPIHHIAEAQISVEAVQVQTARCTSVSEEGFNLAGKK